MVQFVASIYEASNYCMKEFTFTWYRISNKPKKSKNLLT